MAIGKERYFTPVQLSNTPTEVFTLPSSRPGNAILEDLTVRCANTDTSSVLVTFYLVPDGDTAADDTVCAITTIAATEYANIGMPKMVPGDAIYGKASTAAKVTITDGSSTEYT